MSIVSVGELWDRRRTSYRDYLLVHYLMYQVVCDNGSDGTATAAGAAGIPRPGDAFVDPYENVAYLTGIEVDPRNGADRVFEIQVEFTTLNPSAPNDNPLLQPPGYTFTYNEQTSAYFTDNTPGTPKQVVNSAGDPFETFMQRETGELQVVMTRNEATHDAVAMDAYGHTINTAVVTLDGNNFDIGTLKLSPIQATKSQKTLRTGEVVNYYAKTYTFKARHEGWHDMPLDIGFNELVGTKTKNTQNLRRIVDSNGNPVTKPWALNGSGVKMPNATDTPATLDFQPYIPMDWSGLSLT
jgi:hypothetical protein